MARALPCDSIGLMDTNTKGDIAEVAIAASLTKAGYHVLIPQRKALRYDLVIDDSGAFKRVQCKWANLKGDVVVVRTQSSNLRSDGGRNYKTYNHTEIEFMAAYCMELDQCYLIPVRYVNDKTAIQLRLTPTLNGQSKGVWMAADFQVEPVVEDVLN